MRTSGQIKAEIKEKFGFVPPFFGPADETPEVLENLWQQTLFAYVNNPIPALFKEKLSAYLSRYCAIPYCMICHSCTLRPLGMTAKEVLELLESASPTEADINEQLRSLDLEIISLERWPNSDTALEKFLFYCSIFIFLEAKESEKCQAHLRRILTPQAYNHLVAFIAYVKTCHIWMLSHPEVAYEADKRVQDYYQASLTEEPALADFFANYRERVKLEHQSQALQLLQEQVARQEAEAAQSKLQRIFMQTPAAILISQGSDHIVETVNLLYTQLVGKRELIGKPIREVFPELEGQGFFELLDGVYATGKPFVGNEMRAKFDRNNDGVLEESFWNFVYQPLLDANDRVYGIMTHAVEVTEQVRARQEIEKKAEELVKLTEALQRSNRELDRFAYVTSHDLKAPLRGIANLSEWIEEDLADCLTEESREHLNLLRGRVQRLDDLINGILAYSRAGRFQSIERVNVASLVSETIELLAPPSDVKIVIEPEMPTLITEQVPLQQVFMNLIANAIQHGEKSDICIRVGVQESVKHYEFYVSDDGIGVAPEYHQKIWEIFQRLQSRDRQEGTGIGLSVIKKIVESRGGRVWLESEVGLGATFRFTWSKSCSSATH